MRKLSLGILTLALIQWATPLASAAEMFENLTYGDTKKVVQAKLEKSKRFNMPPKTMFGRTGLNGMFKAKQKLKGLEFSLYFGWKETKADLLLSQVDLYSSNANSEKLQTVYNELVILLTELYGRPKFNNGMPMLNNIDLDATAAGACWFYETDAVMLSVGNSSKGHNIVISFMDKQPKLIKTP